MAEILSSLVPLEFSEDGTTWKRAVCRTSSNSNITVSVDKEETDCGVFTGVGSPDWSFDFEGIVNDAPTATEASYKDLQSWIVNRTKIYVRQQAGTTGASFYESGMGYITSLRKTCAVNKNIAFSATFTGSGAIDITP